MHLPCPGDRQGARQNNQDSAGPRRTRERRARPIPRAAPSIRTARTSREGSAAEDWPRSRGTRRSSRPPRSLRAFLQVCGRRGPHTGTDHHSRQQERRAVNPERRPRPNHATTTPPTAKPSSWLTCKVAIRTPVATAYRSPSTISVTSADSAVPNTDPIATAHTSRSTRTAIGTLGSAISPSSTARIPSHVTNTVRRGKTSARWPSPKPPRTAGRNVNAKTAAVKKTEPERAKTKTERATRAN